MNNMDNARKILLKGIHRHPKDCDLYMDAFRIELLVAEAIEDEDQRVGDNFVEKIQRKCRLPNWFFVLEKSIDTR